MPYSRPYGSGGFKDTPDTSTPITAAALNTIDVGVANAHSDIASTLATIPSRNRIVNGGMMVDQRRAGGATAATTYDYIADRFYFYFNGATANALLQRVQDGPPGVSAYSARVTVNTTKSSLVSTDYLIAGQNVEGFNVADLGFGTASPQPVVFSFYVKSSVVGTYAVAFQNADATRTYLATYAISAANTWERKTVAFTADASGTWKYDHTAGVQIVFSLGAGTGKNGTANAWNAGAPLSVSGATNLFATAGATWQVTGVQLEYGTTPTRFEHRSFEDEYRRCRRYYQKSMPYDVTFGTVASGPTSGSVYLRNGGVVYMNGNGAGNGTTSVFFNPEMRATPTIDIASWTSSNLNVAEGGTVTAHMPGVGDYNATVGNKSARGFAVSGSQNTNRQFIVWQATAEL